MEKLFKLKAAKTNIKTEILAGITTFFTMAYIIFVNPNILADAGMDKTSVMVATCLSAAIGTFLIGWLSNYPFALAPSMGLNAFFAYTICGSMGYSWQAGLAAVFISGTIFVIITITGLRAALVNAIPRFMKLAISGGIGLFIALIGLSNSGIIVQKQGTIVGMGNLSTPTVLLAVIGFVITACLVVRKVKGSLLIGILATTAIGAIIQFVFKQDVGIILPETFGFSLKLEGFGAFTSGFGELFSFKEGTGTAIVSIITVFISLTMVDLFDTIGTFIATAEKAKLLDKNGELPRAGRALLADAIATVAGAILGTSTVTTYVESTAGVNEGGRTGLTSMTVAVMFLLSLIAAPILGIIPGAATAPILIIVGILMLSGIGAIKWYDFEEALPAFMIVVLTPFTYSVADGIGLGFIFFAITKVVAGKAKEVGPIIWFVSALFLFRFVFQTLI